MNPSKSTAVTSGLSDDRFRCSSCTATTVPERTVIALVGPISNFRSARSASPSVGPGRGVLMLSKVPSGTCSQWLKRTGSSSAFLVCSLISCHAISHARSASPAMSMSNQVTPPAPALSAAFPGPKRVISGMADHRNFSRCDVMHCILYVFSVSPCLPVRKKGDERGGTSNWVKVWVGEGAGKDRRCRSRFRSGFAHLATGDLSRTAAPSEPCQEGSQSSGQRTPAMAMSYRYCPPEFRSPERAARVAA